MDSEVRLLNILLSRFDKDMFAERDRKGVIRVYHKAEKFKKYLLEDGTTLVAPYPEPYVVFSLTDTWGYAGATRRYGTLVIEEKLKQIALENRDRMIKELEESERKESDLKEVRKKSLVDDMAHTARDLFKESTKDVLFHQIKDSDTRRKNDKLLKGI